ncbi:hypothetical protein [Flagellimonas myxillae]|uniref:hypothetical protein n=1 Tax=Flagellimonas myxillae TaxID=2942214 RepID=UPI00201F340C|nr:hypothetical protein [Muricauda myxillae]MCL6265052.1 hypothetical protein [Muricauda myxillae]
MASKICSYCSGAGTVTDYSSKKMVSASYYAYDQKLCLTCGGTGYLNVPDPPTYTKPTPKPAKAKTTPKSTKKSTSTSSGSGTKDFFTFLGLIAGAILGFQLGEGDWIVVLISAGIVAALSRAMYKIIIAIIVLIVLYFIFTA